MRLISLTYQQKQKTAQVTYSPAGERQVQEKHEIKEGDVTYHYKTLQVGAIE
jgi:hypothetical protein